MRIADLLIDIGPLRTGRAFRVAFTARLVSVFGLGFATVALPLWVYALTSSSLAVALVSGVNALSMLAGTLVGGVLADRFPRRTLIVLGRGAATAAFTALTLASLWPGPGTIALICACTLVNGFLGTFSTVALQAAVPSLVPPGKLAAAAALLALTNRFGVVAAPALSGVIIAVWGYPAVFAATAAVCAATTLLVLLLPPLEPRGRAAGAGMGGELRQGLAFCARHRVVGPLILLGFVQLLLATPYILIPELVDRVLGGGEAAAGVLYSVLALGAVAASLGSGWTGRVRRGGTALLWAVAACGLASAAFGLSPHLAAACVALLFLGFAETVEEILRFTLIQSHAPDALRGRVNSVWNAQSTVGGALGALMLGALAPLVGAAAAVAAAGAAAVAATALLAAAFPALRGAGRPDSKENTT